MACILRSPHLQYEISNRAMVKLVACLSKAHLRRITHQHSIHLPNHTKQNTFLFFLRFGLANMKNLFKFNHKIFYLNNLNNFNKNNFNNKNNKKNFNSKKKRRSINLIILSFLIFGIIEEKSRGEGGEKEEHEREESMQNNRGDDVIHPHLNGNENTASVTGHISFLITCTIRFLKVISLFFPLVYFFPFIYAYNRLFYNIYGSNLIWWRYLRYVLERLGGSWIKLGQWSSTRRDIFPEEFINCISKLCYRCPTHDFGHTQTLIESTYDAPLESLFRSFERRPLASGAIGQVHLATLQDGTRAVVKVLHPRVGVEMGVDLALMKGFARLVECLPGTKWLSVVDAIEEFSKAMKKQVDFRVEGHNLSTFNENFKDHPTVTFPRVIESFPPAEGVLVESFEEGQVLQDSVYLRMVSKESRTIAKIGLDAYLKMMLLDNFVHADLHPGNILVRRNPKTKQPSLVFLDVGLVSQSTPEDWEHFKALFRAIVEGKGKEGAMLMIRFARDLDLTPEKEEKFVNEMNHIFTEIRYMKMSELRVGEFLGKVLNVVRSNKVKIEGNFSTLCLGTAVLEGIGRQLDPELSLLDASIPLLMQGDVVPEDSWFRVRALIEKVRHNLGL